jgi:hypothetical protein
LASRFRRSRPQAVRTIRGAFFIERAPELFERLADSVAQVSRYVDCPDHEQAIDQCVANVEDLTSQGRIMIRPFDACGMSSCEFSAIRR